MQTTSTNGQSSQTRELLDEIQKTIEKLELEVAKQREEIESLRAERDEFRSVVYDHFKKKFGNPADWDDFDRNDYSLTIEDLIAVIRDK